MTVGVGFLWPGVRGGRAMRFLSVVFLGLEENEVTRHIPPKK